MLPSKCYDNIRFSLSDDSGVLRIEALEIIDATECRNFEQELHDYLIGRPLAEVDLGYLGSLTCDGNGACDCLWAVIQKMEKHQQRFLSKHSET